MSTLAVDTRFKGLRSRSPPWSSGNTWRQWDVVSRPGGEMKCKYSADLDTKNCSIEWVSKVKNDNREGHVHTHTRLLSVSTSFRRRAAFVQSALTLRLLPKGLSVTSLKRDRWSSTGRKRKGKGGVLCAFLPFCCSEEWVLRSATR